MKILVIGSGFIGSSIIRNLEQEGHEILIFSQTRKAGIQSPQVVGDIFSWDDFLETLAWEPHVIVHTAWITSHGNYRGDSSNFDYAEFTARLAIAVPKHK
jgi:nucleoside-diphosphate-sugar epimerase